MKYLQPLHVRIIKRVRDYIFGEKSPILLFTSSAQYKCSAVDLFSNNALYFLRQIRFFPDGKIIPATSFVGRKSGKKTFLVYLVKCVKKTGTITFFTHFQRSKSTCVEENILHSFLVLNDDLSRNDKAGETAGALQNKVCKNCISFIPK